jgi:hypothetical protein
MTATAVAFGEAEASAATYKQVGNTLNARFNTCALRFPARPPHFAPLGRALPASVGEPCGVPPLARPLCSPPRRGAVWCATSRSPSLLTAS